MKMFYIDKKYTQYVHDIAHEDIFIALFGDVAHLGLSTAATAIPVGQTTKVLAAAATAVGAAKAVYIKDVLLAQTLQLIETQMRTDRASVKQTISARMVCETSQYPIGMVLSDLDAYTDAGTITSALVSVNQSVSSAQPTTSGSKGTAAPTSVTFSVKVNKPTCPIS